MKASRPSSEATIALMVESLSFSGRSARQRPARKPHSSRKRLASRRTINSTHNGRMSRRSETGMASIPWCSRTYARRGFRPVNSVQTSSPVLFLPGRTAAVPLRHGAGDQFPAVRYIDCTARITVPAGIAMTRDDLPQPDPQQAFDVARQVRRLSALQPRQMGSLLLDSFNEWSADNAGHLGAALAYYALFSITPILVVGIISLFLGASAVVNDLRNSLNVIWKVSSSTSQTTSVVAAVRDMFSARLYAFVIVFGAGVVSVLAIVAAALIAAVGAHFRASLPLPELVLQTLSFIVAMALTTTMFTLVYKTVPDASVSWGDAVIGAMVTALLFNLGGVLLSMVVGKTAASVYGAAGSVIALLLWVYYSAQLFFFGAELTRIFANRFGGRVIPRPHVWRNVLRARPTHALAARDDRID